MVQGGPPTHDDFGEGQATQPVISVDTRKKARFRHSGGCGNGLIAIRSRGRWYLPVGDRPGEDVDVDDKSLYAAILGLKEPWGVEKVDLRLGEGEVHVWVALPKDTLWVCPDCLAAAPIHDHREREWRHLDTCQYRTLVHTPGSRA